MENNPKSMLAEVSQRIREMREVCGISVKTMAEKTEVSREQYMMYERGEADLPFTFIHKCSLAFGIEMTELLEGSSARLSSYTVTRKGGGAETAKEDGIQIRNLAPMFRSKLAEPYFVTYEYSAKQQTEPIHLTKHSGQEFDLVLSGKLKVQVGEHTEILSEGDSIYYNSSTPHGMIAIDGEACRFLAVVMTGDDKPEEKEISRTISSAGRREKLVVENFVNTVENEEGALESLEFKNEDSFNFAFDIVDALAEKKPDELAMLHLDNEKTERRFTFADMKRASAQCANYFTSLGIKRGDRVMLVLKRNYQFWFSILALHKMGAIAIPATNQLKDHDFEYRFDAAGVSAIICSGDDVVCGEVNKACEKYPVAVKVATGGKREGWHDFDEEYKLFSGKYEREADAPCGDDPMLMFFTSGTTGYPKIALHSYKYPLGHFVTAKYWHCAEVGRLHFTISDTGWGKALWGKLYGQWMCESSVFTYDFDRFNAADILPLFKEYGITTFCAPPTMYRMLIKEDLSKYDLSSVHKATTAGEALNPEVFRQVEALTGLKVMEGFGQTETTLTIGNLVGRDYKLGSMGRPVTGYDIDLVDHDGNPVPLGETGEVVVRYTEEKKPCGLFLGYYRDGEKTAEVMHDGLYHTGDLAWKDEDGFYWYVGRADDVIKSSGYRIGPFEIESVIMELPYVLECGVSASPDEVRGQVVKASIVLVKGTEPSDDLKKEIQNYVKEKTAPYKYPRIVEFRTELPKTISGKIQRNKL